MLWITLYLPIIMVDIHSVFYSDFEKNYTLRSGPILIDLKNHILLWVTLYLPKNYGGHPYRFFLLIFKEKIILQGDSKQNEPFSLI